ncbi:hypothetical protein CPB85DRAFT_1310185 [Mucidula mucida]|nr:hypothetical protein CPB85DRAFT_1310185 [Mucidula mucida]
MSHQLDLKTLIYDVCAFIPFKVVKRFVWIMQQTPASAAPQSTNVYIWPECHCCHSIHPANGIDNAAVLHVTTSCRYPRSRSPQDGDDVATPPVSDSTRPALQATTTPPNPLQSVSTNGRETVTAAPSTPRCSRKRPISAQFPSPIRDVNSCSPLGSPSRSSLTKYRFGSECSSAHNSKKTRVLEDMLNIQQGEPSSAG